MASVVSSEVSASARAGPTERPRARARGRRSLTTPRARRPCRARGPPARARRAGRARHGRDRGARRRCERAAAREEKPMEEGPVVREPLAGGGVAQGRPAHGQPASAQREKIGRRRAAEVALDPSEKLGATVRRRSSARNSSAGAGQRLDGLGRRDRIGRAGRLEAERLGHRRQDQRQRRAIPEPCRPAPRAAGRRRDRRRSACRHRPERAEIGPGVAARRARFLLQAIEIGEGRARTGPPGCVAPRSPGAAGSGSVGPRGAPGRSLRLHSIRSSARRWAPRRSAARTRWSSGSRSRGCVCRHASASASACRGSRDSQCARSARKTRGRDRPAARASRRRPRSPERSWPARIKLSISSSESTSRCRALPRDPPGTAQPCARGRPLARAPPPTRAPARIAAVR